MHTHNKYICTPACIHVHTCTFTHKVYINQYLKISPLLAQWGATALLSAAFGGSGLLGKTLLEDFNSSLDEVANVSVNGDVQMASEV